MVAAVFSLKIEFKENAEGNTLYHLLPSIPFLSDEYGFLYVG